MQVLTRQVSYLGFLAAFGFVSLLTVAIASDGFQPARSASPEYLAVANEACPNPPETPASSGAEEQQPQAAMPELYIRPPVRSPLRPAIYVELLMDADESSDAKIVI